jgi:hypothetical protein
LTEIRNKTSFSCTNEQQSRKIQFHLAQYSRFRQLFLVLPEVQGNLRESASALVRRQNKNPNTVCIADSKLRRLVNFSNSPKLRVRRKRGCILQIGCNLVLKTEEQSQKWPNKHCQTSSSRSLPSGSAIISKTNKLLCRDLRTSLMAAALCDFEAKKISPM